MAPFPMCGDCAREYADIRTRRYHAQPDCCPACGPRAFCLSPQGEELPGDPIARAQRELAAGRIVAVKGVGGFHLACDARSEAAVRRLRARKHRPEKAAGGALRRCGGGPRLLPRGRSGARPAGKARAVPSSCWTSSTPPRSPR